MKLSVDNLHSNLEVDKNALDDEIMRQPQLFSDIGDYAIDAVAERDTAKEALEVVDAKLDIEWRKKLSSNAKVTEKMVANLVKTDVRHEKAFNAWLVAKSKSDRLEVLQKSFFMRANLLKALAQLYSSNYWMESSIKAPKATIESHYNANRVRISNARAAQGKP
jgi:uncharacterized membrane protein YheB (UPF0754 family)